MKKSRKIKSVVTLGVGLFVLRTALFVWTLNIAMNSYQYINGSWWEWNSSDGISKEKQHGPLAWFLISIICGIGALFDPLLIFGALRKKVWAVHIWNFAQVFLCCIPLCALIPFTNKLIDEISEEMEIKRQEYVVISSGNNASNV